MPFGRSKKDRRTLQFELEMDRITHVRGCVVYDNGYATRQIWDTSNVR